MSKKLFLKWVKDFSATTHFRFDPHYDDIAKWDEYRKVISADEKLVWTEFFDDDSESYFAMRGFIDPFEERRMPVVGFWICAKSWEADPSSLDPVNTTNAGECTECLTLEVAEKTANCSVCKGAYWIWGF